MTATILKTNIATANRLKDLDYEECVRKRGLNPEWIAVNCRSMEIRDASARLGYTAKSAGIWLESVNGFGQFRPNKPWKNDLSEKKAPKYRTATGEEYDAMLPHHPHNPRYWDDLEALKALAWKIDGHPCLGITEGMFKALAACSNDIPCVALAGVQQGLTPSKDDPQGKRYLVETLERFSRAGFGWIIAFDADAATNSQVREAQRILAHQLAKFKVPVYIATGLWSVDQGKGMDDYIKNNGAEQFKREIMAKAYQSATWEKQFKDAPDSEHLSESSAASQIAEKYRAQLAWHVGNKAWYWYETENKLGVWGEVPHEEVLSLVITELEVKKSHFSSRFVNGIVSLLKAKLKINRWEVYPGYICLQDCVLDVNTLKEYPHEPGYRMLNQLPFKWGDRLVGCEPILKWLQEICEGKESWVQVLRAAINATVTERGGQLQRFMELVGAGGTGKGTLLRLVQGLLGRENYVVTDLKQLEQNRFETAMLYGKKAVFITDSERYTGDVSTLKKVTGNDELRNEKKGVQQTDSFRFPGMVWIATNEIIQSSDYTNALARRRLSMPFERVIPPHMRRDLEKEFAPYLPGFLCWVLSMPVDEVSAYIADTSNKVPSLSPFSAEVLLSTNPLADWANDCLYYDPNAITQIGDNGQDPGAFLYPNYCEWANKAGHGIMTKQRFSSILLNLLKTQLSVDAEKIRNKKGRFISKIAIRLPGHDFPLLVSDLGVDQSGGSADLGADPVLREMLTETIGSAELQENADLFHENKASSTTNQCCLLHDVGNQKNQDRSAQSASSALARVSASTSLSISEASPSAPASANPLDIVTPTHRENAETIDSAELQSISQQILPNWDSQQALGKIILAIADTEELRLETRNYTKEQMQHIKDAANSVWKIGVDALADYSGEMLYIWECGQSNDVRVGTKTKPTMKVRRANLRPWLGI